MKWTFKSKQYDPTLCRLAGAINHINSCNLVSIADSTYYKSPLPFCNDFSYYTFIDLSFTPYLEIRLLDNENQTFILDGTQKPFLDVNSIAPFVLTNKNVYEYALLVLGNTKKKDDSYRLVNSIDEINFSSEPTLNEYQQIESSIKKPKIKRDKDSFLIKATVLLGEALIEASIKVSFDGRVNIIKEKKLLDHMPIHELTLE
jgi:hypothetical protein